MIEMQGEAADCGYLCASLLLAIAGLHRSVSRIKSEYGTATRGLSIRHLRDAMRFYGLSAEALFFDRTRATAYPCPGILLLSKGHYIVLAERSGENFEIYDPGVGWSTASKSRLARQTQGLGISVDLSGSTHRRERRKIPRLPAEFWRLFTQRLGWTAVAVVAMGQLLVLAIPLLSQASIDRVLDGNQLSFLGAVGLGFILMSILSASTSFLSQAISLAVSKRAARRLGGFVFDRLARLPPTWFDQTNASNVQAQVGALDIQFTFVNEAMRSITTLVVTALVGLAFFALVSPWLVIPGIVSALLGIGVDLWFNRRQLSLNAASIQASQRRMALNYDMLTQIPVLARFGALSVGRLRYLGAVTRSTTLDAEVQSISNWRSLTMGVLRSADQIIFVTISAALMLRGDYSLGAFVAMGAYKDLLGQAIVGAFDLRQRYKMTEVQRFQTRDLLEATGTAPVTTLLDGGAVSLDNVRYRYGSLEHWILDGACLTVEPGECAVIRGTSGIGKSTVAKLIVGSLSPEEGRVLVDGCSPQDTTMLGLASVLQSDRLISATVRDNIVMFRKGCSDEDVMRALRDAEADEFVDGLPMRLNTYVSDYAAGLSGGQKQRLLIARALLAKPKLLILDEATASLEVDREARVLSRLKAAGVTLVVISHRPEVWKLADALYDLEKGRLHRAPLEAAVLLAS